MAKVNRLNENRKGIEEYTPESIKKGIEEAIMRSLKTKKNGKKTKNTNEWKK